MTNGTDTKVLSFLYWLENNEVTKGSNAETVFLSPQLRIEYTTNAGFGMYKSENGGLTSKEPLIKIPKSLLLNHLTCMKHILQWRGASQDEKDGLQVFQSSVYKNIVMPEKYYDEHIASLSDNLVSSIYLKLTRSDLYSMSSFQLVSLFLATERNRGSQSFWAKYIEVLPSSFSTSPLFWEIVSDNSWPEPLKIAETLEKQWRFDIEKMTQFYLEETVNSIQERVADWKKVTIQCPLVRLLPVPIQMKVRAQYIRFMSDYLTVVNILANRNSQLTTHEVQTTLLTKQDYLWAWLCINSRCLYMTLPRTLFPDKTIADCFTLCPLVDFFNHSDNSLKSCNIDINQSTFSVYAPETTTSLEPELYFHYGSHLNEFLMIEYGFVLSNNNQWEAVDVSSYIDCLLDKHQRLYLEEMGYYLDYTLSHDEISYRTTVVLSLLSNTSKNKNQNNASPNFKSEPYKKINLLINGMIDELLFEKSNNEILVGVLKSFIGDVTLIIGALEHGAPSNLQAPVNLITDYYKYQLEICQNWLLKLKS